MKDNSEKTALEWLATIPYLGSVCPVCGRVLASPDDLKNSIFGNEPDVVCKPCWNEYTQALSVITVIIMHTKQSYEREKAMIEVSIEANEPWTMGQRTAVQEAVLTFCERNSPDFFEAYGEGFGVNDADAQLTEYTEGYEGFGANAHPDADQFVLTSPEVAQRFADAVRAEVGHIGMTVKQFSLTEEGE